MVLFLAFAIHAVCRKTSIGRCRTRVSFGAVHAPYLNSLNKGDASVFGGDSLSSLIPLRLYPRSYLTAREILETIMEVDSRGLSGSASGIYMFSSGRSSLGALVA